MLANDEKYADSFRTLSPRSLDVTLLELCREKRQYPQQRNEQQRTCREERRK